jgi:hypothetical protein
LAIYIKHLNDHGYINAEFLYGNPASKIADARILKATPLRYGYHRKFIKFVIYPFILKKPFI